MTSIKMEDVKQKNRELILKLLNNQGATSRKDIACAVGITSASVTKLCKEMLDEGVIEELGEISEDNKVGRKKILVDIVSNQFLVGSMSIEQFITFLTLTDLKGKILWTKNVPTQNEISPDIFLKQLCDNFLELFQSTPIYKQKILGIGVTLRGIVDPIQGKSIHAYHIWEDEVMVQQQMELHLNCPVLVENNMRAFAQAELVYGLGRTVNNLFFLKWYPGIGSALVIDRKVYSGKNFREGEIGHTVLYKSENICTCGRKGCLETEISLSAIAQKITEIFSIEQLPILYVLCDGDRNNIHNILVSYLKEEANFQVDEVIDRIFIDAIDHLARVTTNTITLLTPEIVVLIGEFFESEMIYQYFLQRCKLYDPNYQENYFIRSPLQKKSYYIGGIALIVNKFFLQTGGVKKYQ